MESSILKIVGSVAGIGGLALGVLLIIFRDVIRKNIFPTLTKEQAYSLIRLIIILSFFIAVLGLAAWVYTQKQEANKPPLNNSNISQKLNGMLVKSKTSPTVYYLESGMRRPITIPDQNTLEFFLEKLGMKAGDIVILPDSELNKIPLGPNKDISSSMPIHDLGSVQLEGTIWRGDGLNPTKYEFRSNGKLVVNYSDEEDKTLMWDGAWKQVDKNITIDYNAKINKDNIPITYLCQIKDNKDDVMNCEIQPGRVATNYLTGDNVLTKIK